MSRRLDRALHRSKCEQGCRGRPGRHDHTPTEWPTRTRLITPSAGGETGSCNRPPQRGGMQSVPSLRGIVCQYFPQLNDACPDSAIPHPVRTHECAHRSLCASAHSYLVTLAGGRDTRMPINSGMDKHLAA